MNNESIDLLEDINNQPQPENLVIEEVKQPVELVIEEVPKSDDIVIEEMQPLEPLTIEEINKPEDNNIEPIERLPDNTPEPINSNQSIEETEKPEENNIEPIESLPNNIPEPIDNNLPRAIDILEDNQQTENNNENITPKKDNKPIKYKINKRYHGFEYHITTYIIVIIILISVSIIFAIGYNFSKNVTLHYNYNSKIDYQVCLKKNEYYKEQCLQEDQEYISSITENIMANFNYTGVYDSVQNKKMKYYLKSKLVIKTDNEASKDIFKEEKKLIKPKTVNVDKNVVVINETLDIDFEKYDEYAGKYKNEYGLIGNSTLYISLIVIDNKQEKEVSSITIPLTELTYTINKKESTNKIESYTVKSKSKIKYMFIGLIGLTVLLFIYTIYRLIRFLILTLPKESKYNKQIKRILNVYDRVIITLEDKNTIINDNEIYTVKTFLELLDVRDTIDKPILYYRVNDVKTEFYVQDVNKTYKFVMKESDFEDNQ